MEVINVQQAQISSISGKLSNAMPEEFSKVLSEADDLEEPIIISNEEDEEETDQLLEMMVGCLNLNLQNEAPNEPIPMEGAIARVDPIDIENIKKGLIGLEFSGNSTVPTEELSGASGVSGDFFLQSIERFEKAEQSYTAFKNDLPGLEEEASLVKPDPIQISNDLDVRVSDLDVKASESVEKLLQPDNIAEAKSTEKVIKTDNTPLENELETELKNDQPLGGTVELEKDNSFLEVKAGAKVEIPEDDLGLNPNAHLEAGNNIHKHGVEPGDVKLSSENVQKLNDTIIQLLETTKEGDTSVLKVKLYPENLGRVDVSVKMEEGKLIANIMVDNEQIKGMFTKSINELSESLLKQNIQMERINIDLKPNTNSNSMNQSFNNNQHENSDHQSNIKNRNFRHYFKNTEGLIPNGADIYKTGELSILA